MQSSAFVAALLVLAGSAGAQVVHKKPDPPARRAGIAPPPVPTPPPHQQAVPVAAAWIPAVLMSDGRVYADFGFGLEAVMRPCAATGAPATAVAAPLRAPNYGAPPAPVAGAGMSAPSGYAAIAAPPQPVQTSARCWMRDAMGRVLVAP